MSEGDWKAALPEELRADPTINQTQSVESLARQLVDAQKHMGRSLAIPGEQAGEDAWNEFNQKLKDKVPGLIPKPNPDNEEQMQILYGTMGRPESPSEYRTTERTVPEGVELNNEPVEQFRELAHKAGLNQKQFQAIVDGMTDSSIRDVELGISQHNDSHRELNREWGLAAEDRKMLADKTRREFFPHLDSVEKLPVETVKGLYTMGSQLGTEATGLSADLGVQTPGKLAPEDARMQLADIGKNRDHPYWNQGDPAHSIWGGENGKYVELVRQANPGEG